MIIFGWRGVTTKAASGAFHCPACGPGQPYTHKRVRRFFTLYFIPVIPLNQLGEYIECQCCNGTYQLQVLEYRPEEEEARIEARFQSGARQVMIHMLLADGVIEDSEVAMIRQIYGQISGTELPAADLRAEIARMQAANASLSQLLGEMRGYLNPQGVEMIIRAAYMIALSDGEFHDTERALLWEIAQGLGMMPAHFKGLMSELMNDRLPAAPPPIPGVN